MQQVLRNLEGAVSFLLSRNTGLQRNKALKITERHCWFLAVHAEQGDLGQMGSGLVPGKGMVNSAGETLLQWLWPARMFTMRKLDGRKLMLHFFYHDCLRTVG